MREFVARVASTTEAVPAGGSVIALSGAASAALLVLVCGVLRRRDPSSMLVEAHERAGTLQQRMLDLVDEDAAAFRAFLGDKRSQAAIERVCGVPLEIAGACAEVIELSRVIEERTQGPLLGDVRAARHLATAALAAAADLADQDVPLHTDEAARQRLQDDIAELRRSR